MKKWVRAGVFVLFFGWLCSSLAVVNKIEIGLDQVTISLAFELYAVFNHQAFL
jgi:hypothetical protein